MRRREPRLPVSLLGALARVEIAKFEVLDGKQARAPFRVRHASIRR